MASEATKTDDGGAAFPQPHDLPMPDGKWASQYNGHPEPGMSLRDYFAAKAMSSMMSSYRKADRDSGRRRGAESFIDYLEPDLDSIFAEGTGNALGLADAAYHMADLMLAARKAVPQ